LSGAEWPCRASRSLNAGSFGIAQIDPFLVGGEAMCMALFDDDAFDYLTPTKTATFTLADVVIPRTNRESVTLELKYGGESNERYQSAIAKAPRATGRDALKQSATLLARHVIVGWSNVLDKAGQPIRCTPEGAEELLHALIEKKLGYRYLGPLVAFVNDPTNFREPVATAEDLGNE
jgi:hypothetical protein